MCGTEALMPLSLYPVLTGRDGGCVESDEVAQIAEGQDLRGCHHSQRLHCERLHPFSLRQVIY